MIEAFQRWIKRFGSRPWDDELQKAFEAGYRAGAKDTIPTITKQEITYCECGQLSQNCNHPNCTTGIINASRDANS